MKGMNRRAFLKTSAALGAGAVVNHGQWEKELTSRLFSSETPAATENINADRVKEIRDFCGEYGTPYNPHVFEAGERIVFKGKEPYISFITRDDVTIPELTINFADADGSTINLTRKKLHDVNGAVEIPLNDCFLRKVPRILQYKLNYKKPDGGSEETCYRYVKTPSGSLRDGSIKIIVFSDAHFPDDRGKKEAFQNPETWEMRNNGEYVNRLFLSKLAKNPNYQPSGDEGLLMNGFNMASAMWYIINNENPDFTIDIGDNHGGFGHVWEDLGLPKESEATPAEKDAIIKMFRLGQRKILSAITSHIPWYYALGNHEGECGGAGTLEYAMKWRKKYLPLPGLMHGGSPDENYYPIIWGGLNNFFEDRPEVLCAVMNSTRYSLYPRKPEEWTAGEGQTKWLAYTLQKDASFRLVFFHHVFGGWPTQSDCEIGGMHDYAYGRGMGFTSEYYDEMNKLLEENGGAHLKVDPRRIEQVYHTGTFKRRGVNAVVYGHDHVFKGKKIGTCDDGRELHAVCAGSTKHDAETSWFRKPLFRKDYGDRERRDFFTCPGYLVIEISPGGIRFDYKNASPVHLNRGTNMPEGTRVGDTVSTYLT